MVGLLLLTPAAPADAGISLDGEDRVELAADFRFRLEVDWGSRQADGRQRQDRNRARVRVRVGLTLQPGEGLELGLRLRSGSEANHQGPHITVVDFDGNDTGDADFDLDRWYLRASRGRGWAWAGRNGLPFWGPHEFVFDGDVTPAGLAAGYGWRWRESELTVAAGHFTLPVGMRSFSGSLTSAQAVYARRIGATGLKLAGGVLAIDADRRDPDASRLLNGNGFRDYQIWAGSFELRRQLGRRPLTLSGDWIHNAESYSPADPDPFTAANFDQTDGWAVSLRAGSLDSKGDWLGGYTCARIETLAVHSSYSQDDWLRWGSAAETRATNMQGHELRLAYALSGTVNLVARLYLVEAITTVEDGKRFRLDLNYRF